MDTFVAYPDSPMEQDDAPFPCKGCGEPLAELSTPNANDIYGVQILEEGKAFELAGNRWHIDCFRCNTCGTLLDSDANLLLLGDGSLICNNCTYSCSACGNKIEDLAILTGDQAFCATCFRCRNCKKKIENLKYARTSQGIFCMDCHESLMQRRRKKSAKNGSHRREKPNHNHHQGSNMLLDKSLPSLPVDRIALSPDNESLASEGYSDTPTELPRISQKKPTTSRSSSHSNTASEPPARISQKRPPHSRSSSSKSTKRERSPAPLDEDSKENLMLPSTTYKSNRHSTISQRSDLSTNGEEILFALDPNTAPGPSPLIGHAKFNSHEEKIPKSRPTEAKMYSREYYNGNNANGQHPISRVASQDHESTRTTTSGPNSPKDSRHSSQPSSPHIAYQEIGRDLGLTHNSINSIAYDKPRDFPRDLPRELTGEPRARPTDPRDTKFMLQEAPKSKKSASTRTSRTEGTSPSLDTSLSSKSSSAPVSAISQVKEEEMNSLLLNGGSPLSSRPNKMSGSPLASQDLKSHELVSTSSPTSQSSMATTQLHSLPQRSDSLAKSGASKHQISRREVGSGANAGKQPNNPPNIDIENDKNVTMSSSPALGYGPPAQDLSNGVRTSSKPTDSPSPKTMTEGPQLPLRARERDRDRDRERERESEPVARAGSVTDDSFTAPRIPPNPPSGGHKSNNASVCTQLSESTQNGEFKVSPSLPRYSAGGEFSMDEDLARILGNVDHQEHASFLRRVSHSVRHARSYSDRGSRLSKEPKWPKSPLTAAPGGGFLPEISSPVPSSPDTKDDITYIRSELHKERQKTKEKEKRLRELEKALEAKSNISQINTELHEKRSTMVFLDTQKEMVIRELELLTEHIARAKKNEGPLDLGALSNHVLLEFAEALQKLKDSFTPQIADLAQTRNELAEKVAELTEVLDRNTQELEQLCTRNTQLAELNNHMVSQIQEFYKANAAPTLEVARPSPNGLGIYTHQSQERSNRSIDSRELESSMTGSTVVNELDDNANTAYPQVVNIHKAHPKKFINWGKKATRGIRGTFGSNDPNKTHRDGQTLDGQPYGSGQTIQEYPNVTLQKSQTHDPTRQGFALFGNQKQKPPHKNMTNGTVSTVNADSSPALFGSDLEHRTEYERGNIPGIVTKCIQEVELRGMDTEGIYRKSGGNTQIQQIKEGFERTNDYDISDPDLDINAVTSTLKQYFHKLPSPLITFEVYDKLLESAACIEKDPNHCISLMRTAINELPPRHRDCLEFLLFHLQRVIAHERDNLMTSLNVAVVFAPTIMRPESLVREMSDTQAKNLAVQFLIENCSAVFQHP